MVEESNWHEPVKAKSSSRVPTWVTALLVVAALGGGFAVGRGTASKNQPAGVDKGAPTAGQQDTTGGAGQ